MSRDDELVEQIRSQLHLRAGSVTTAPDVEQQVLRRARTIKRRQLLTQVLPVVGVAALASVTFGVLRSPQVTPSSTPTVTSTASIPQVTPSSTPTVTSTASSDRSAVYKEAAAYLQSFLDSWQKDGLYAAGQKYVDPSQRATQTKGNLVLRSGTVTSTQPSTALGGWVSADHFTVIANFDLRFSGNFGAWGNGPSGRYVTFVRSSASAPYQITFATGP